MRYMRHIRSIWYRLADPHGEALSGYVAKAAARGRRTAQRSQAKKAKREVHPAQAQINVKPRRPNIK